MATRLRTVLLIVMLALAFFLPGLLFYFGILSWPFTPAREEFDFSIGASPTSRTVTAGQTTNYSISVSLISGSTQKVSLSLSGMPSSLGKYSFSSQDGNSILPPF